MNAWTLREFETKDGVELVAVDIQHTMLSSFSVFESVYDALAYLETEKMSLDRYANLRLDLDIEPNQKLMKLYANAPKEKLFKRGDKIYIR